MILWFEVDVTSDKNNYLVRFFHGLCFASSFLNAAFIICLLALDPQWITKISKELNNKCVEDGTTNDLVLRSLG